MFPLPLPTSVVSGRKTGISVARGSCSNFDSDSLRLRHASQTRDPRDATASLLLISSASGQKGPRQEAVGFFGSQSRVRKLSDPCGGHWPTSEVVQGASEGFGVFFFFPPLPFQTPAPTGDSLRLLPSAPDPKMLTEFHH